MPSELIELYEAVELVNLLRKEACLMYVQHPCKQVRMRAGWEAIKLAKQAKSAQRKYIAWCDQRMSLEELLDFLNSQNIKFNNDETL